MIFCFQKCLKFLTLLISYVWKENEQISIFLHNIFFSCLKYSKQALTIGAALTWWTFERRCNNKWKVLIARLFLIKLGESGPAFGQQRTLYISHMIGQYQTKGDKESMPKKLEILFSNNYWLVTSLWIDMPTQSSWKLLETRLANALWKCIIQK